MSKTFAVEITATRVMKVTVDETDLMDGEDWEDAAEQIAHEHMFEPDGKHDGGVEIEAWNVDVETITLVLQSK